MTASSHPHLDEPFYSALRPQQQDGHTEAIPSNVSTRDSAMNPGSGQKKTTKEANESTSKSEPKTAKDSGATSSYAGSQNSGAAHSSAPELNGIGAWAEQTGSQ